MFKFNNKYIEKVSMLGRIDEINDEAFNIIFQPHNNRGAKVSTHDNVIDVSITRIDDYTPLVMWTHPDKRYFNLTEKEALQILMNQFGEIES